jgi:sugar phosphate isomerase/epimerase
MNPSRFGRRCDYLQPRRVESRRRRIVPEQLPLSLSMTTIDYVFWPAAVRRFSFREHIEAAHAGGFTSLAVAPESYRQGISSGLSPKDMVTMANDQGVALRHLDTLTDWAPISVPSEIDAGLRARFDVSADECFAICEALGLETILAVAGYDKNAVPLEVLIDGFGRLCDRAALNGLWVDLEFMPFWGLPDLASAWEIVAGAQRKNAGIMVDTWHFSKGNPDFELLRSLPGELFVSVQVADAMKAQRGATLFEDTVRFRKFPGEGELPVLEILTILHEKGHLQHIGPEVFSDEADALSPKAAGKRSAESLGRVLAAAGIPFKSTSQDQ